MEINNKNYVLPEKISINILSRLPAASVLRCSLVRKSWRNLIVNNREFARMHLLRGLESHHGASVSNGRLNFLLLTFLGYDKRHLGYQLYYTLDDDNDDKPIPTFRVLSSNPNLRNNKNYYVVGSCNGLICMAYDIGSDDGGFEEPIYICNPITREWLTLPSLTMNDCCSSCYNNDPTSGVSRYRKVVCGFGYLPSTDEYKVVRITYCGHVVSLGENLKVYTKTYREGRVHVYTLGDGTGWREKGVIISYELAYYCNPPSILANGALHFLEEDEGKIVAFDLTDEEFLFLPPPPCFTLDDDLEYPFKIQVLGGQLCAFHHKENSTVGMWFFKNEKEEENGNYKDGNGQQEYKDWSWIKEYDIEFVDLKAERYIPFILTKQGDVLYYCRKRLFCYEFKDTTSKEPVDMEKCLSDDFRCFEAIIPHLNSFISLKALGEEDTKVIIESAN